MLPACSQTADSSDISLRRPVHASGTSASNVDSYHHVQVINPNHTYYYYADAKANAKPDTFGQSSSTFTSQDGHTIMNNQQQQQQHLLHFSAPASSTIPTTNYYQHNPPPPFSTDSGDSSDHRHYSNKSSELSTVRPDIPTTNYYQHNPPPPFSTDSGDSSDHRHYSNKSSELSTVRPDIKDRRSRSFEYNNSNSKNKYNEFDSESSSSYLFLRKDDPKYHYTNFLTPNDKNELLMTMLSEMSFWEAPSSSSSSSRLQDRHHSLQQQQVSIGITTATRTILTSASTQNHNDPRSERRQLKSSNEQLQHHSGTYGSIISRFRNGNNSNSRGDSATKSNNVQVNAEKTGAVSSSGGPGSPLKRLSTNGGSQSTTGSPAITNARSKTNVVGADEDDLYNKELDALDPSKISWKHAVDPATGRVYYYDSVTRKTQWEKVRNN
jgi:WW domain